MEIEYDKTDIRKNKNIHTVSETDANPNVHNLNI